MQPQDITQHFARAAEVQANAATVFASLQQLCHFPTPQLLADELLAAGCTPEQFAAEMRRTREFVDSLLVSWEAAVVTAGIERRMAARRRARSAP